MNRSRRAARVTAELGAQVGRWWGALQDLSPAARATSWLLMSMIVGGVCLRIQGIGFPPRFTFDEQFFVPNARHYLLGVPDENDHPPLGKLFIAVGILALGDNPVGWRVASLVLGLQTLVIAYLLAARLFVDRRAGLLAAAFVAADGFFLAYARTALLDGGLACLVLWSLLAAVTARTWRGVLISALLVGLATTVKWSGALALVPVTAVLLWGRRVPRRALALLAVAPILHLGVWLATFPLSGRPLSASGLASHMLALFRHHLDMGKKTNPLASPWYSWPALYHPIVVKLADAGTKRTYASSAGNPVLFGAATLGILATFALAAGRRLGPRRSAAGDAGHLNLAPFVMLAVAWLALLLPWTVARGAYVFMYHYLPSYGFALVLLAGAVSRAERRAPLVALVFVAVAFAAAAYMAPVWAEFPLSEAAANHRLVFIPWRP
jgi:dolichyl-phosphate-mannose--protein O-mannosyl transferase